MQAVTLPLNVECNGNQTPTGTLRVLLTRERDEKSEIKGKKRAVARLKQDANSNLERSSVCSQDGNDGSSRSSSLKSIIRILSRLSVFSGILDVASTVCFFV